MIRPETRLMGALLFHANACYGDLKPGTRFTFPKHPGTVYVKARGGWYTEASGAPWKYRTGSGTAVVIGGAR